MGYRFSKTDIKDNQNVFVYEESAYTGVRTVAGLVREDIAKVFGAKPIGVEYDDFRDTAGFFSYPVFFGTVGHSRILDELAAKGAINLFNIAGEREVWSLSVIDSLELDGFVFESAIVIAGSDKRGTIYGLFALSELLGVSPFVNWLDAEPAVLEEFVLTPEDSFISKTPSVMYRGFFINDEWPAFGNWCEHNHGGFNAKAYFKVFELLLRLKGNYLWPAMWSAVFPEDGPGLKNAELADELGVIMGTSHHEPCMRQGEEYKHVRGPGSIYGDAWDFAKNREGITRFWADGIARNGRFENVYTVGMRGEADTAIAKDATLAGNIALLKEVISTQNRLLAEGLGRDISDIPRLLVLYKEVEPFFYGDAKTPGLCKDNVLDGITLMLSDDNHGNLRTVPPEDMRDREGGWGIYYHLDYHGEPVSYEWFNTSYLPKIWEQMSAAYDLGIKQAWIVNVGDIFTNEYPLAFFLDMAYDHDRWGTSDKESAEHYTRLFVGRCFPGFTAAQKEETVKLLLGYTGVTKDRRTEAMNDRVYAPFAYGESDERLKEIDGLMRRAEEMYGNLSGNAAFVFYQIVYLPLTATLNIQKMWILTGKNHAYASFGSTYANTLAGMVGKCLKTDRKLVEKLHKTHKGKWYGMGLSEHIGFINWCEEECRNPVVHTFEPADKPRLVVSIPKTGEHSEGGFWSGRTLAMTDALNPQLCGGFIEVSTASSGKVSYSVATEDDFIDIIEPGKSVKCGQIKRIFIFVDRMKLPDKGGAVGHVCVSYEGGRVDIEVPVSDPEGMQDMEENTYISCGDTKYAGTDLVSIAAARFYMKDDTAAGGFEIIPGYGRSGAAIKAYPQNTVFTLADAPSVTYRVILERAGRYNVRIYTSPANPCYADNRLLFGIAANGAKLSEVDMIPGGYAVGDGREPWMSGVIANVHTKDVVLELNKGVNEIKLAAISPGFVPEKIVISPEGEELPYSYMGPPESFHS